jgi:uncharacterized membrane protein
MVRHGPALLALVGIGGIYLLLSPSLSLGPRGLLLGLIVALLVPMLLSLRRGLVRMTRTLGLALLGVVTLAEAASAILLVLSLAATSQRTSQLPHETALGLLRDAALIWLVNVLTFALWYWELDGGGPGKRHHEGYHSADFVFPQLTLNQPDPAWNPRFVDYLFLAFNTSTAFSPTDTLVLSRRAKWLMMTQSLISLMVLAILAARAINTL